MQRGEGLDGSVLIPSLRRHYPDQVLRVFLSRFAATPRGNCAIVYCGANV